MSPTKTPAKSRTRAKSPARETAAPNPEIKSWPSKDSSAPQPWADGASIVVEHQLPTLTAGTAGPEVFKLGELLGKLGYETSVSRGENPFGVVDASVLEAVRRFRADYNVAEDPSGFGGNNDHGRTLADNHVGPWTWEGLLRAVDQEA